MKIAFATTDGTSVDEHFGRAGTFAVYEMTPEGYRLVEMRRFADGRDRAIEETKGTGQVHDDLVQQKVERLADCKIIYLTEIGGPSAARLVKKGIMPIKVKEVVSIDESLKRPTLPLRMWSSRDFFNGTAFPEWMVAATVGTSSDRPREVSGTSSVQCVRNHHPDLCARSNETSSQGGPGMNHASPRFSNFAWSRVITRITRKSSQASAEAYPRCMYWNACWKRWTT